MLGKYSPTYTAADLLHAATRTRDAGAQLRRRIAELHGVRHVLLFDSARSALCALLHALGRAGAHDQVVLPAFNCLAVPEAVTRAGWRPLFADIAAGDVNMTADSLARRLSPRTRAVLLTHQFGVPAEVGPILDLCRAHRLIVIEDAAAALGAQIDGRPVGSFGDASIISFHLTKVLNAGRAGALLTNDDTLAARSAALRLAPPRPDAADLARAWLWWSVTRPTVYGMARRLWGLLRKEPLYEVVKPDNRPRPGGFHPCSAFVANLVNGQLDRLGTNAAARQALARVYTTALDGINGVRLVQAPSNAVPAWIQYPIFVENKEACYRHMLRHGIDLNWTFRYSCAPAYGLGDAPESERAARTLLGLPTYPSLATSAAARICKVLRDFVGAAR